MAIWYWNDSTTTGTASTSAFSIVYSTTATSTGASWTPYPRVITKRVFVKQPLAWDKQISDAWVRLVNEETDTGWKIEARINGDIEIIDPFIDVREMKDFIGLLTANAKTHDRLLIEEFFAEHGTE